MSGSKATIVYHLLTGGRDDPNWRVQRGGPSETARCASTGLLQPPRALFQHPTRLEAGDAVSDRVLGEIGRGVKIQMPA